MSLLVTTARDEAGSSGYAASRRFLDLAASTGGAMRVDSLVADRGGHNFGTWAAAPAARPGLAVHLPAVPEGARMISPLFDITGRIAVVTGSSRGIGLALAEGLAGAGAGVVLNARDGRSPGRGRRHPEPAHRRDGPRACRSTSPTRTR